VFTISKAIMTFTFFLFLFSSMMIPTSAFASDTETENNDNGFFQSFSLSSILALIKNDSPESAAQNYNSDIVNYRETDNWWAGFVKWWCSGDSGHNDGGDTDGECRDLRGSWGNHDGCKDSREIWKWWYCR
jgi:hypothetical protein